MRCARIGAFGNPKMRRIISKPKSGSSSPGATRISTIAEKFNTYRFADYKESVIELLGKVYRISVETMKIVKEMETIK